MTRNEELSYLRQRKTMLQQKELLTASEQKEYTYISEKILSILEELR